MKELSLKWKGPILNPADGYSAAGRDYIYALNKVGVDVTVDIGNQDLGSLDLCGETGKVTKNLANRDIDYDFVIAHHTPDRIDLTVEPEKVNIGYNTAESDYIPQRWVENINSSFDIQLVPSSFNKWIYKNSGVNIPIYVLPHCIDPKSHENIEPFTPKGFENHFKFLSIGQYTERKNILGLLKAYFSSFYNMDNVIFILKVFGSSSYPSKGLLDADQIKKEINDLKSNSNLKRFPPIYLITKFIDSKEMISLYKGSDCFVLPTHSEGFGLPFLEASIGRCVIIATNYGGQVDFLKDIPEPSCFLLNYQMTPITNMPNPNFDITMSWAEPNLSDLKYYMKQAYYLSKEDNFDNIKNKPKEIIDDHFSHEKIGNQFKEILLNEKAKREKGKY